VARHAPWERRKIVQTVRLNHLRAVLLAAAAAGLLAAAGLMVVLYAQPAEANYPDTNGKIAYAGYDGNDSEIYTIKTDGGGRLNFTDNSADDYYPSYSPSGKKIAYVYYDGNDSEIYTIKPDGGGKIRVTDNSTANNNPYWGSQ
jgi:WD40-like Beta Propeller Repeat